MLRCWCDERLKAKAEGTTHLPEGSTCFDVLFSWKVSRCHLIFPSLLVRDLNRNRARWLSKLTEPSSMCVVTSFPFTDSMVLKKWSWMYGRRGCSDEGGRECQEVTSACVLTTSSRSLVYNHGTVVSSTPNTVMCIGVFETAVQAVLWWHQEITFVGLFVWLSCVNETWKRLWVIRDTIFLQECAHASWTCTCNEGRNSLVVWVLIGGTRHNFQVFRQKHTEKP